jgi:hypothetical protein
MSLRRVSADAVFVVLLVLVAVIFGIDFFFLRAKSADFDALVHVTTIQQFAIALRDGDFPVRWADGFANYGLPLGNFAHQIPAYAGALLTIFITSDPLVSYHLLVVFAAASSALMFYFFCRLHFTSEVSFIATFVFMLAPYRIINIYIRGALPEFMGGMWFPLLLVAIFYAKKKCDSCVWWPYLLLTFAISGLILTHPLSLVVYAPFVGLYYIWGGLPSRHVLLKTFFAVGLAVCLSAYYFLPLNLEAKYLYHGASDKHYAPNQTTTWRTFFDPVWRYSCIERNDIFGRCHLIKAGVTETGIVLFSAGLAISTFGMWPRRGLFARAHKIYTSLSPAHRRLLWYGIVGAVLSVMFSSQLLEPVYARVRILGNIQFPWRFMSAYLFFPPILLAIWLSYVRHRPYFFACALILIAFFCVIRFPQLYAKNYRFVPMGSYSFTPLNLHSVIMNPIWTSDTNTYPIKRHKAEVVVGDGEITRRELRNSRRIYTIVAKEEITVSDNTFYFPGWKVYVNGVSTDIQFQDPAWRGVITFRVPRGEHTVEVVYQDTRLRRYSNYISLFSLMVLLFFMFFSLLKMRGGREVIRSSI